MGGVDLAALARDPAIGTPTYVYDLDAIAAEARALAAAFGGAPHLVAYAVKANSAGPILKTLLAEGCGADVVSGAELALALACGVPAEKIVYSGVAKLDDELDRAIACGARGVGAIQLESIEEIVRVERRAQAQGRVARVSARMNPSVEEIDTHAHIATGHDDAKFGIPLDDAGAALAAIKAAPHVELVGFSSHVGSQFTSTASYVAAARALFGVVRDARAEHGRSLTFVDTGGGFGIDYGAGCAVHPADFVRAARAEQSAYGLGDLALYVEPGRSLVAAHGVLLARVVQDKRALTHHRPGVDHAAAKPRTCRQWLMIDAGMNDLLRPALYQARHRIVPLEQRRGEPVAAWRVVGPVCESSDDFGEHELPSDPPRDVAILDAGAYGFTMASRYNGRALPAEVFLRGGKVAQQSPRAASDEWVRERLM